MLSTSLLCYGSNRHAHNVIQTELYYWCEENREGCSINFNWEGS